MWTDQESADIEPLMEPEEGEDMPKQIGMGRGKVREMKITRTRLRQIIKEEIQESYDTNRDGSLSSDELRRIADEIEGSKPLVKRGGRHDRIPGYTYNNTIGVHVRSDHDYRRDHGGILDKVLRQMGINY